MAVTERELHVGLHRPLPAGHVDVAAVLAAGRRRLRGVACAEPVEP